MTRYTMTTVSCVQRGGLLPAISFSKDPASGMGTLVDDNECILMVQAGKNQRDLAALQNGRRRNYVGRISRLSVSPFKTAPLVDGTGL